MASAEESSSEENGSSFLGLADEIIDIIFSDKLLDCKDLCRCSEVCTRFYAICRSPELWRKKALQRWVFWKHSPTADWLECFRQRTLTENHIVRLLHKLTKNSYTKVEVNKREFQELESLIDKSDGAVLDYTKDTLLQLLESNPREANLTHRYYAGKAMAHLKCHQLRRQWEHFLSLPVENQHLEEGAVLVSKWVQCNMEIDEAEVGQELDKIADLVRSLYEESTVKEAASSNGTELVDCLKMLKTIRKVLFKDLGFSGNSDDYYNVGNSLIDKVLESKSGNPISLSVVFAVVARRLGVMVEPVNFPNHFLLRWSRSNRNPEADDNDDNVMYIDCFNEARFMSQQSCIDILVSPQGFLPSGNIFPIASPTEVFSRIMANIVNSYRTSDAVDNGLSGLRNALELLLFLKPNDLENQFLQARIYIHLGIYLEEAVTSLEVLRDSRGLIRPRLLASLLDSAREKQRKETFEGANLKIKFRSDQENTEVAYKVGTVMRHRRYHYGCVIYGWDPVCKMDDGWIHQMGVDGLQNGRHQPFYNVLGNDGSCRYASQESLQEEPGQDFNPHPELGKHFKAFTGTQYIPNKSLREWYPEDLDDNM